MYNKITYPSPYVALRAVRFLSRQPGFAGTLAIYPCSACGAWHLTSHRVGKTWRKFQNEGYWRSRHRTPE